MVTDVADFHSVFDACLESVNNLPERMLAWHIFGPLSDSPAFAPALQIALDVSETSLDKNVVSIAR